jgi:hypothetical protein
MAAGASARGSNLASVATGDTKNTSFPPFVHLCNVWLVVCKAYAVIILDIEIEFVALAGPIGRRSNAFGKGKRVDRVPGPTLRAIGQRNVDVEAGSVRHGTCPIARGPIADFHTI